MKSARALPLMMSSPVVPRACLAASAGVAVRARAVSVRTQTRKGRMHGVLLKDQSSKLRRTLRICSISTGFYFCRCLRLPLVRPDGRREDGVGERGQPVHERASRPPRPAGARTPAPGRAPARSSGRKCSPATRLNPSTMPAISFSDQPIEPRIRFTTTRTGTPPTRSRRSTSPRASRASPTGSAAPTTTTSSARSSAASVSALRPGRPPRSWPGLVLEAEARVHDDVADRRAPARAAGRPGRRAPRASRSARGRPVTTARCSPTPAAHRGEALVELARRREARGGEDPRDLVEDAELLGHRPAVGVEVGQHHVDLAAGDLPGQVGGDGRTPRGTGRSPDHDHPAGVARRCSGRGRLEAGRRRRGPGCRPPRPRSPPPAASRARRHRPPTRCRGAGRARARRGRRTARRSPRRVVRRGGAGGRCSRGPARGVERRPRRRRPDRW